VADRYVPPEQRVEPGRYTSDQLMAILLEDARRNHATDLRWMTTAIAIMAHRTRRKRQTVGTRAEEIFAELEQRVIADTGHGLPMHSGPVLR